MRHYIGNRLVEAEKAVRIDGKVYTYDVPIPKSMNREEGYKVYYPDGYETFMKKEDFEKIYHLHEREELAKAAEEECACCCDESTAGDEPYNSCKNAGGGCDDEAGCKAEAKTGPEELPQTIRMMLSDDFKERTKAEYWQLKIRLDKLKAMCKKYAAGELTFKPNCPLELLKDQVTAMDLYLSILEDRAKIENIDLNKVDVPTVHIYKQGTDEKTKDRECTPPVDSEWDTETKDYKCKSTHFDSIEDMKKTMEAEEDLPDDKEKVFVRISENEDGAMESVIIGPVEKVMTTLEAVFAEQLNSIFTDDTPDIFKKLMLTAAMASLRKKVFDVFESKKNK